jgi:hypothetical protein
MLRLWLGLVIVCPGARPSNATGFEFILKLLEQFALTGRVRFPAYPRISPRKRKVHFGTLWRKPRALLELLDRSFYLPKIQQDTSEDVPSWKHFWRQLHGFFGERQRSV